jgi:hypothetical protein
MTELPWKPVIYLPANLTVRFNADVLLASDPSSWCQTKAVELLGSDTKRLGSDTKSKEVKRLARMLSDYAELLRSKNLPTTAAMFFWPDFTRFRAFAEIYLVGEDPVAGQMTMTRARELAVPDESTVGKTVMAENEVPAGSALRIHRFRRVDPEKRRNRIGEEVTWFIWPPDSALAVMMITRWLEPVFSEAGIKIADDMAQNFRVEPLA